MKNQNFIYFQVCWFYLQKKMEKFTWKCVKAPFFEYFVLFNTINHSQSRIGIRIQQKRSGLRGGNSIILRKSTLGNSRKASVAVSTWTYLKQLKNVSSNKKNQWGHGTYLWSRKKSIWFDGLLIPCYLWTSFFIWLTHFLWLYMDSTHFKTGSPFLCCIWLQVINILNVTIVEIFMF